MTATPSQSPRKRSKSSSYDLASAERLKQSQQKRKMPPSLMKEQANWNSTRRYHALPVYEPNLRVVQKLAFPIIKKVSGD